MMPSYVAKRNSDGESSSESSSSSCSGSSDAAAPSYWQHEQVLKEANALVEEPNKQSQKLMEKLKEALKLHIKNMKQIDVKRTSEPAEMDSKVSNLLD